MDENQSAVKGGGVHRAVFPSWLFSLELENSQQMNPNQTDLMSVRRLPGGEHHPDVLSFLHPLVLALDSQPFSVAVRSSEILGVWLFFGFGAILDGAQGSHLAVLRGPYAMSGFELWPHARRVP